MSKSWTRKDLLGLRDLRREEIELILKTAESFKEVSTRPIKKVPTLRGRTVVNFFFEPSTRTRASFEIAERRLSADTISFSSSGSSMEKGETLLDTAKNIEALKADLIVMRHSASGAPHRLSQSISAGIINAGDGTNEHPTQALLDMFTMKEKKGRIEGLHVVYIGDILHSRVARSNIWGLMKLGARVTVCGPKTLLPIEVDKLGVRVTTKVEEAIEGADAITLLRIQLERQKEPFFPSVREYASTFGITRERLKMAKKDVIIMHPGPINRGVEIADDVVNGPYSVILDQVTNGIAVRMAVLYLLSQVRG
ncbi:MAG TPA: aspartate carbamoyltransferase catalytic subunit [Candidatus Omnitrophota bacterium]|nr:aspartate carbamoyltransferase catalytic subunit [Candidatus Omnitrophota bacterium]